MRYVECPRDSWQGLGKIIPTEKKLRHILLLLNAGFTHLDLGSFVSIKAVPQMADTEELLANLPQPSSCQYICIIANERGLERALNAKNCNAVAYPLSISETFQRRNTNTSLGMSWPLLQTLFEQSERLNFTVHLSMGFGNPYGDPWDENIVLAAITRLRDMGIQNICLADTYGQANARRIKSVSQAVIQKYGAEQIGLHLHARAEHTTEIVKAAVNAGVTWFEGALAGIGGCPFAGDELVGNLATELVLPELNDVGVDTNQILKLAKAAKEIQKQYQ